MNRIKAIIVDDERLARLNLRNLLAVHNAIEIVGEADSIKTAVELINLHEPQLIFLDIQLRGETGFDLLELVDNSIKIIFVTAYDEYAIRAFEVNAADYLLKPVNPERLNLSLERIIANNKEKSVATRYEYSDSIYVRLNNYKSKFIKIGTITFIEPVGNYSKIFTADGNHFLVLKTLKQWEEELPVKKFIRIHRSCIVNVEYIERIERISNTNNKAYLKNIAQPLIISRRSASRLKDMN